MSSLLLAALTSLLELNILLKILLLFLALGVAFKIYLVATLGICKSTNTISGKTVIITGANTGIGYETALDLAKRGGKIILACRNLEKANKAKDEIVKESQNENIFVHHLDLASLKSVRRFAADILKSEPHIDILINNAGCCELGIKWTEDGLEYQMQSNHFGHFLLTNMLLGLLKKSAKCRIINVSSDAHYFCKTLDLNNLNFKEDASRGGFFDIYGTSKLCNILFTKELARKVDPTGDRITVNALHPGAVATEFARFIPSWFRGISQALSYAFIKTAREGAQTSIHVAVSDEVDGVTGEYFRDCKIERKLLSKLARDQGLAKRLWEQSETLVALKPEEIHF